jgi:two-component system OmpR family sensor kinase
MKNISITAFINMIFSIALIIMGITIYIFITSFETDKKSKDILRLKFLSETLAYNLQNDPPKSKIRKFFNDFNLKLIPLEKVRADIEDRGKTSLELSNLNNFPIVRVFDVDNKHYIYVNMPFHNYMLTDKNDEKTIEIAFIVGSIIFIILVVIYIMLLKKLAPIKKLNKQIERFGEGDLNVKITYDGDDEIGKIAKSFDSAIKHIRQLINSKNLFMRNIMHELKTPITTSRIIAETVEDDMARGVLIKSFNRMNELIEDLAQIERITMYSFVPVKDNYKLSEIFEQTKDMLLKEEKHFEFKYEDSEIYTDKELLALVLKNLIDNAIKYSPNNFALIQVIGNKILVKSKGEKLKEDLSYYIEPFSQEEKRSSGFGLGLYIVANITEKLGYKLRYRYDKKQKENIFEIILD